VGEEGKSKKFLPLVVAGICVAPATLLGCIGAFLFVAVMIAMVNMGGADEVPQENERTSCGDTVTTLVDGFDMMPTTGKLGLEQHLSLSSGESAEAHYQKSNTPAYARNGMAGGYGGLNSGPPSVENERWASNTQWYWWMLPGCKYNPCLDKKCQRARELTAHARIVLTNKNTGESVVTSAEESGPACWVTNQDGRNWGVTAEVWHYLKGGSTWPSITAAFAKDQNTPLGPCND
jgi:hypothetical protein